MLVFYGQIAGPDMPETVSCTAQRGGDEVGHLVILGLFTAKNALGDFSLMKL